jgi:hypothetical protein
MQRNLGRALLLFSLYFVCSSCTASVLRVKADAPGPAHDGTTWQTAFATIPAALSAAAPGDEVWVAGGTYVGRLTIPVAVSLYGGFAGTETDRSQRVRGENRVLLENDTYNGGSGGTIVVFTPGAGPATVLDGFMVFGSAQYDGDPAFAAGIICRGASPTISHNQLRFDSGPNVLCANAAPIILANDIYSGYAQATGVTCDADSAPVITGNRIAMYQSAKAGVYCMVGSRPRILNNSLVHNSGQADAVLMAAGSEPVIAYNIIAFNDRYGIRAEAGYAGGATVRNNCVYQNLASNYGGLPDLTGADGNISADPRMLNSMYGDIHIQPDSPCVDAGDDSSVYMGEADYDGQPRIQGAHVDIGADESDGTIWPSLKRVFHVRPDGDDGADGLTWTTAKKTLRNAAAWATGWDEVWVAEGVYRGVDAGYLTGSVVVVWRGTSFYGGFAGDETERDQRDPERHVTVLDADRNGTAISVRGNQSNSVLDGFTICNAGDGVAYAYAVIADYLTVRRCVISDNLATSILLRRGSALENSTVADNAGLVVVTPGSQAVIRGNLVTRNGGGIIAPGPVNLLIENNRIVNNNAVSTPLRYAYEYIPVGGVGAGGNTTVRNNLIVGNAGPGPGVTVSNGTGSEPSYVYNNTIVGNASPSGDAAVGVSDNAGTPSQAVNNIVAFNASGVYAPTATAATFRNNCVFGNAFENYHFTELTGQSGNISADPLFASTAYGDYHIQPSSPCMDAGDDFVPLPGETDLDGQPRVQGARVDIGADESDGTVWNIQRSVVRVRPGGTDASDGATWATAKKTVGAALAVVNSAGGEVWVAGGTYPEAAAIGPYTSVYGGFSGEEATPSDRDGSTETIFQGDPAGPVLELATGIGGILDGFTVQGGQTGIVLTGASATLRHLRVIDNGAGVLANGGMLTLEDSEVSDNAGIGVGMTRAAATLRRNMIAHNVAAGTLTGGGIQARDSDIIIADSEIRDNAPRGVDVFAGAASIAGNVIEGNGGDGDGGGILFAGVPYANDGLHPFAVSDNRITGNHGVRGGGVAANAWPVTLSRNVITGNTATGNGAGIALIAPVGNASSVFRSNLIADNQGSATVEGIYIGGYNKPTVLALYNNTLAGHPVAIDGSGLSAVVNNIMAGNGRASRDAAVFGTNNCFWNSGDTYRGPHPGNIVGDPRFIDAANGNYRLQPDSPCVDIGDNSVVPMGARDADGNPRIVGLYVDFGAYESAELSPPRFPAAIRALRIAAGLAAGTPDDLTRLETDTSRSVTIADATRLLRRAVGLDTP